jgi:hypothetical protein
MLGILGRLHRLEGQVKVIGVLGQVGTERLSGEARDQAGFQVHGGSDRREVVGRSVVEIDPQQLALADPAGKVRP